MIAPETHNSIISALDSSTSYLLIPVKQKARKAKKGAKKLIMLDPEVIPESGECPGGQYFYISDKQNLLNLISYWTDNRALVAIDLETGTAWREKPDPDGEGVIRYYEEVIDPFTCPIFLVAMSVEPGTSVVFDMRLFIEDQEFLEVWKKFLTTCQFVAHNSIFDQSFLTAKFGVMCNFIYDTLLVHQLMTRGLDVGGTLGELLQKYCGLPLDKEQRKLFLTLDYNSPLPVDSIVYAAGDVSQLLTLTKKLDIELKASGLYDVWTTYEQPLMKWIALAKVHGVDIDTKFLGEVDKELVEELAVVQQKFATLCPGVLISSPQQIKQWFISQGIELKDTNVKTIEKLVDLPEVGEVASTILYYRKVAKMKSTYVEPMMRELLCPLTGRVHPNWGQLFTDTGRMSCISKGTMVEVIRDVSKYPTGIPIEDVKVGDLVYTFDNNRKLTIKPVIWAGKTGHKEIVRLHWQGDGRKSKGYIDLTPDHRVRLVDGSYREAKDLVLGDRVLSISRGISNYGYGRLWATGHDEIRQEHQFIFSVLNGYTPENTHHANENKLDNRPENLIGMTVSDHHKYHANNVTEDIIIKRSINQKKRWEEDPEGMSALLPRGERHPKYKGYDRDWMEKILWENAGKPTVFRDKYGIDYETTIKYLERYGIDWKEISKSFNSRGELITFEKIEEARKIGKERGQKEALKYIGLGYYRWKKLQEDNGLIPYNHRVLGIETLNRYEDVYCLTVEDTHNFIAGSICVANCKEPNLQNLPSKDKWVKLRGAIKAKEGHTLVYCDFSQFEVRGMADMADEDKMTDVFLKADAINKNLKSYLKDNGLPEDVMEHPENHQDQIEAHPTISNLLKELSHLDFHKITASMLFGIPVEEVDKEQRRKAKAITFGKPYGAGPRRISQEAGISIEKARELFDDYDVKFPKLAKFFEKCREDGKKGMTHTPSGRRRYYQMPSLHIIMADVNKTKKAGGKPWDKLVEKWGTDDTYKIADKIHSNEVASIEREAMNMPIQGLNADATKLATILAAPRLQQLSNEIVILLWVHDEIGLTCPDTYVEEAAGILKDSMIEAANRLLKKTPVDVSCSRGKCWGK